MKNGKIGVTQVAGIVLILLILIMIVVSLTGLYGQLFEDSIKKMFGIKTETEITHEQNERTKEHFDNLIERMNECESTTEDACSCNVNLNDFGPNYEIRFTESEIRLLYMESETDWRDENAGILFENVPLKLNCYWNDKLEQKTFKRMLFLKGDPYIFEPIPVLTPLFDKGKGHYFTHEFNILKINGKMCWVTDKVKEETLKDVIDCEKGSGKLPDPPKPFIIPSFPYIGKQ